MRRSIGVLALVGILPLSGFTAEDVKSELREGACLPSITLSYELKCFHFSIASGFSAPVDRPALLARVRRLKMELHRDAADAERFCRLGELYHKLQQGERRDAAYERAVALARKELQAAPDEVRWQVTLGEALRRLGQYAEAETVLRKAVAAGFQDWRGWAALGDLLANRAWGRLYGTVIAEHHDMGFVQLLQKARPSAECVRDWERLGREAADCYSRSIALRPPSDRPYSQRAFFRVLRGLVQYGLQTQTGEAKDVEDFLFEPETIADLRQAAQRTDDDFGIIGIAILGEVMALAESPAASRRTANELKPEPHLREYQSSKLSEFPHDAQRLVMAHLDHLERMTEHPETATAAGAADTLAGICVLFEAETQAERWLRKALALDPARESATKGLAGLLAHAGRYRECVPVLRQGLQEHDSAYFRFLLAVSYEALDAPAQVEQTLRAGLRSHPEDFLFNLSWAIWLMKKDDAACLARAGRYLERLKPHVSEGEAEEDRRSKYEWALQIYAGLSGDARAARACLARFEQRNIDAAIEALEQDGSTITRDDGKPDRPVVEVDLGARAASKQDDLQGLRFFPHLRKLTLSLEGTDETLMQLPPLANLRRLNLSGEHISNYSLAAVLKMPNLEELGIWIHSKINDDGLRRLQALPKLRVLELVDTAVTDAGLACLQHFPALESLWVDDSHHQRITERGIVCLKDVRRLKKLVLNTDAVTDAALKQLTALTELRELDLSFRDRRPLSLFGTVMALFEDRTVFLPAITDDGLAHIARLASLERLSISGLTIGANGSAPLARLRRLTGLTLWRCDVPDQTFKQLAHLHDLRRLSLSNTPVTSVGLAHISKLVNLRLLDVSLDDTTWKTSAASESEESSAPPSGPDLRALAALSRLEELDLSGHKVGAETLAKLVAVRELRILKLSRAVITDAALAEIGKMTSLQELKLYANPVTDQGLKHLHKLPHLKEVDLRETRATKRGIAALKKAIPNVKVHE